MRWEEVQNSSDPGKKNFEKEENLELLERRRRKKQEEIWVEQPESQGEKRQGTCIHTHLWRGEFVHKVMKEFGKQRVVEMEQQMMRGGEWGKEHPFLQSTPSLFLDMRALQGEF